MISRKSLSLVMCCCLKPPMLLIAENGIVVFNLTSVAGTLGAS